MHRHFFCHAHWDFHVNIHILFSQTPGLRNCLPHWTRVWPRAWPLGLTRLEDTVMLSYDTHVTHTRHPLSWMWNTVNLEKLTLWPCRWQQATSCPAIIRDQHLSSVYKTGHSYYRLCVYVSMRHQSRIYIFKSSVVQIICVHIFYISSAKATGRYTQFYFYHESSPRPVFKSRRLFKARVRIHPYSGTRTVLRTEGIISCTQHMWFPCR